LKLTATAEPLHAQADGEALGRVHAARIAHAPDAYFALA
jgi:hypothetical protein